MTLRPDPPVETTQSEARPRLLTLLSVFFAFGCAMSFFAGASILMPGSVLEPIWRINPRGHEAFASMGRWALVLLFAVCVACGTASVGVWRVKPYGYVVAVLVLAVNLIGDAAQVILGTEPRAAIGIPIAGAMLWYLNTPRIRCRFFPLSPTALPGKPGRASHHPP